MCCAPNQVFIPEQQAYNKGDLDRHLKSGDTSGPLAESGFKGHPQCRFCRRRFYGDNELFLHMQAQSLAACWHMLAHAGPWGCSMLRSMLLSSRGVCTTAAARSSLLF